MVYNVSKYLEGYHADKELGLYIVVSDGKVRNFSIMQTMF